MIIQLIAFILTALLDITFIILTIGVPYKIKKQEWIPNKNGKEKRLTDFSRFFKLKEAEAEYENGDYITNVEHKKWQLWYDGEISTCFLTAFAFVFSLLSFIFGLVDLANSRPTVIQKQRVEYQMKMDDLKLQLTTLTESLSGKYVIDTDGTYHVIVDIPGDTWTAINTYNHSVLDFKSELYIRHVKANDPLISWFYCKGYTLIEGFNPTATSYKNIVKGLSEFAYDR